VVANCVVCALVATAVKLDQRREVPERSLQGGEVNPQSFLPTLAVLIAIAMLFAEQANSVGISGWLLLACAVGGAGLLTARQLGARYELRRLNLALAMRQADERLTELVRDSSDLVLIVDARRQLTYVSPASDGILGMAPTAVRATPATRLLGLGNETRLSGLLDDLAVRHLPTAEMTAAFTTPNGERRDVQIVASDHRGSPVIAGIVLNIRDITDQCRLERQVIEAVAAERCRLSSDIHEGLGQELAGIALLLAALQKKLTLGPDPARSLLNEISGHVSRTIELAREIARGLSPLQVVRGSLEQALIQLAANARERFALNVNVRGSVQGATLSAGEADHFYRIAVEALNNSGRHSRCSNVDVELQSDCDQIRLSVIDNGIGFELGAESGKGQGLQMMGYRARAMGGSIRIEPLLGAGTRIVVSVPVRQDSIRGDSMP
jgi:PAS domain S-box-containing protein